MKLSDYILILIAGCCILIAVYLGNIWFCLEDIKSERSMRVTEIVHNYNHVKSSGTVNLYDKIVVPK